MSESVKGTTQIKVSEPSIRSGKSTTQLMSSDKKDTEKCSEGLNKAKSYWRSLKDENEKRKEGNAQRVTPDQAKAMTG